MTAVGRDGSSPATIAVVAGTNRLVIGAFRLCIEKRENKEFAPRSRANALFYRRSRRKEDIRRSFDFGRANISRRIFVTADIPRTHRDVMHVRVSAHGALIGEGGKRA
jgi:hypothetical protein